MRSVKHKAALLLAAVATSCGLSPAFAGDEFGLWSELGVEKSYNKKFSLGAELGFRANDNLHSATRFNLGLGASYKPVKGLKFGAGYIFISQHYPGETKAHFNSKGNWNGFNADHNFWRSKHRFYVDVTGKKDIGRVTLSLRERYQLTCFQTANVDRDKYRGVVTEAYEGAKLYGEYDGEGRWFALDEAVVDHKAAKTKHYLRSRIGVEWNIRHSPVDPFATFEVSNNLAHGFSLDKRRWSVGADWKIKKKHVVTLAYVYTNGDDDDDEGNLHAISIGYKYKF